MKFSFLPAAFTVLAVIAILAGCTGTPAQVTPSQTPAPTHVTAAIPAVDASLQKFILPPEKIPFTIANEKSQVPDLQDPAISAFGGTRGYTTYYINQTDNSPTAVQMGQMIVEYPPGNATRAFAFFVLKNQNVTEYNLTWLPDPRIGDESVALTVTGTNPAEAKPMGMVVFRKGNYMESVVMIGPTLDTGALFRAARDAAGMIP